MRRIRADNRRLRQEVLDLQSQRDAARLELEQVKAQVTQLQADGADPMLQNERNDAVKALKKAERQLAQEKTTAAGHLLALEAMKAERDELREDLNSLEEDFAAKEEYIRDIEESNRKIVAEGEKVAALNDALSVQVTRNLVKTTPEKTTVKFKAPDSFDGTGDYLDWIRKVKLFLRYSKVTKEEEMIEVALSYLSGDAAKTMETYFQWAEDGEDMGPFSDFETSMRAAYNNKDRELEARHKLDLLSQTTTMPKYAAEFKTLSGLSGFSQTDLMHRYETKMNGKYRTLLRRSLLKPQTLDDLITWSLQTAQVETQAQELEDASRPKTDKPLERTGGWRQRKAQEASTVTPVPKVPASTPANGETRKCYNCNKTGHISPNCPEPKRPREGQVRINATGTSSQETQSMKEQLDELRAQMTDMNQVFTKTIKQLSKPTIPEKRQGFQQSHHE
jgi:hypothetical protein